MKVGVMPSLLADAPHEAHQVGDVHAHGTVMDAAAAHVAFGVRDLRDAPHLFGVELPALADHFEDGLVELGDGRIGRVVRVGKAEVAGLGAGAAAHTGLFVYLDSRAYLALQDVADHFGDALPAWPSCMPRVRLASSIKRFSIPIVCLQNYQSQVRRTPMDSEPM